ncbi:sialidase family protein [Sphingomicrobium lutaoense]|uniref:DUF1579 domain-containing protein n=1 Tax=Sphingomicrobium lutaoense TaxID=515949 RepID=A0A839Z1K9_9SPHN|nr:hypothetical protein [Sphingomicrobium lutaoense]MBB3763603.1 hypothetical protein [Sphingomicrobium lutaoense]
MVPFMMLLAAQAAPAACTSEAHDAFDFWVGDWSVSVASSRQTVAKSRIEKLYNGCAVRENWMPANGNEGGSLNSLGSDGRWHQRWVGSSGETVDFTGGLNDKGEMVLTGWWAGYAGPGNDRLVRMTYTKRDDGSVRQHGEISTDHGTSWSTGFDFVYSPAEAE